MNNLESDCKEMEKEYDRAKGALEVEMAQFTTPSA